VDRVRRSYAILGLKPGASLSEVRRRYRFLAQRWHPDRHVSDARNQAEAGAEMRRINEAYQAIVESLAPPAPGVRSIDPKARMSRVEVDALANAIGSEGPVDWLLGTIGWVGSTIEGILAILFGVGLVVRVAVDAWRGEFGAFREHPELILLLVILAVIALRELWVRSRVLHAASQHADS